MKTKGGPAAFDKVIGNRIRELRTATGMKQHDVAGHINVSFQQFQKYEAGINRVAASILFGICKALDVSIADFFKEIEEEGIKIYQRSKNSRASSAKTRKKKPRRK